MKRMLAFFLAFLMLLMSVSCGTNKETTETQAQITEDGTYAPEETETDFFHDVERNDYKEEVFRMIGFDAPGSWYYAEEYSTQPGSVHILNNMVANTSFQDNAKLPFHHAMRFLQSRNSRHHHFYRIHKFLCNSYIFLLDFCISSTLYIYYIIFFKKNQAEEKIPSAKNF